MDGIKKGGDSTTVFGCRRANIREGIDLVNDRLMGESSMGEVTADEEAALSLVTRLRRMIDASALDGRIDASDEDDGDVSEKAATAVVVDTTAMMMTMPMAVELGRHRFCVGDVAVFMSNISGLASL